MAENDERNLYQLKQDYKKIEKKYSLPIFEQLNEDFHIEKLAELETEFLIREIRKFMAERIGSYLRFVETLLQPGNSPMFIFSIVKLLDSVDKDRLTKIYKKLAKIEVDISLKILILPFYLLQLFVFVLGVSFFLSSFYVRYRDIIHIWSFLLLMGFFITPITYPLEIVPFHLLKYYLLNPLARMVVDMRYVALYNYIPDLKNFLITLIISVFVFVFGYLIFRKRKSHFVEEI